MAECMCGRGGIHGRGHVWWGVQGGRACMAGETATTVDGTHPTGAHSCNSMNLCL